MDSDALRSAVTAPYRFTTPVASSSNCVDTDLTEEQGEAQKEGRAATIKPQALRPIQLAWTTRLDPCRR